MCSGKFDTCQPLMLTKHVIAIPNSLFAEKRLQMCQKQLTHFPIQCIMHLQTQCSFENMPIHSIGNVSIVFIILGTNN